MRKKTQSEKQAFEKEIASLKLQKDSQPSKKLDELRKQNTDLQTQCNAETKKLTAMTSKYEQLEEQHVFTKAQLASDKETLQTTNNTQRAKIITLETELERFKRDNIDLSRKIVDVQNKCKDLESKSSQITVVEHERKRLLASLQEKNHQYELLVSENEMNKDLSEQWKKEVRQSQCFDTFKINLFLPFSLKLSIHKVFIAPSKLAFYFCRYLVKLNSF